MKKKLLAALMAVAMVASLAACGSKEEAPAEAPAETEAEAPAEEAEAPAAKDNSDISVILVTMDGLDSHWVNVDKGASAAAEELGIKYEWLAPDKKDTALQIEVLNNAIAKQPDAICVAAVDPDAIVSTLQSAADQGIKIVYTDCVANFEAPKFRTDGVAGARKIGEAMLKGLEEKGITSGDIGIVAFSNATQNSLDREQGFRDAFEGTDFNILETQYGNSEVAASQAAAENFISQGVVGIYGNNEPGAVGVGNAAAANKDWKGVAVGFDASETTLDLVDSGALYAVVAQQPKEMGRLAVEAAVKLVNGETLEETDVDTGSTVVTPENTADFRN